MNTKRLILLLFAIPTTALAFLMWLMAIIFVLTPSSTGSGSGVGLTSVFVAVLFTIPAAILMRAQSRARIPGPRASTRSRNASRPGTIALDVDAKRGLSSKLRSKHAKILGSAIDQIVLTHSATLATKRLQKQYTDDYGRLITDKWAKEKEYFVENILTPALFGQFRRSKLQRLASSLSIDMSKWPNCRHLRGELSQAIHLYGSASIEFHIAKHGEAQPPARRDPLDFERECAAELVKAGWDARVMGGSGDQGVDIVARSGQFTCVFQCKLYNSSLGNTPVQEVHTGAGFHNADLAAVATNSEYTDGARAAAQLVGVLLLHESELRSFTPDVARDALRSQRL